MATGAGTANINPMTNLALATATGKNPTDVFADPVGNDIGSSLNNAAIADAVAKIKVMLAPILAAYNAANVDPLKDNLVANNSGMDGAFDAVKISVTSDDTGAAQVSIDNRLTGAAILTQTSVASATSNGSQTAGTITSTTEGLSVDATNLAAIAARLQSLAAELAKSTPNLDPFFAVNYGTNSGLDRIHAMAQLNPQGTITGISSLTIVNKTGTTSFDYEVTFLASFSDGSTGSPDDNLIFTNENGVWKLRGNGFKSRVKVLPQAYRWITPSAATTVKTGLFFEVQDPGLNGIASVTVSGPGLPDSGLLIDQQQGVTWFQIDPSQQDASLNAFTDQTDFLPLSDAVISRAFAATATPFTYTVTVKDSGGNTMETRTLQLAVGPATAASLDASFFPTVSGIASHALSLLAGQNSFTFQFVKPTAFTVHQLEADLSFFAVDSSSDFNTQPLLTASQVTIVGGIPAQLMGADLQMSADDGNRRRFVTDWMFRVQ